MPAKTQSNLTPLPPKEGRVARKRRDLRLRLLRAAFPLVAEKGIEHVSISDITADADCAVGSFYSFFETKDVLMQTLIEEALEPLGQAMDTYAETSADAADAVSVAQRYTIELALHEPMWGRFLLQASTSFELDKVGLLERVFRDIQRGMDEGVFTCTDVLAATRVVGGTIIAGILSANIEGSAAQTGERSTEYVLRALGVPARKAQKLSVRPLPNIRLSSALLDFTPSPYKGSS